jgi:hypothetical protein
VVHVGDLAIILDITVDVLYPSLVHNTSILFLVPHITATLVRFNVLAFGDLAIRYNGM